VRGCTGSPFFIMNSIFIALAGFVLGAVAIYLYMRQHAQSAVAHETELRSRLAGSETRVDELWNQVVNLRETAGAAEELRARLAETERRAADLSTEIGGWRERNAELQAERRVLSEAQVKLLESFQALSAQALQANNQMFLDLADTALAKRQMAIEELVRPLKESLTSVDGKIQELETARVSAYTMLSSQLQSLGSETTNLVKALRTPHTRGQWGEMQLRRTVEIAGMVDYCDFRVQQTLYADDTRLRPDMIVMLPNGRRLVVDSKAPLSAYLDAIELDDDSLRAAKLKQHAAQVRCHVEKLAQKAYWAQFDPAPEFVVAFLPGESFFSAALQHDAGLIEFGADRKVLVATPTTLIALLRAIGYGWRQEKIAQNAFEISRLGRELYERLAKLAESFAMVGTHLDRATKSYNEAAGTFESRVLVSARRMKEKGVTVAEDIPELALLERTAKPLATSLLED
jgi:DNA recombination protein RmuC